MPQSFNETLMRVAKVAFYRDVVHADHAVIPIEDMTIVLGMLGAGFCPNCGAAGFAGRYLCGAQSRGSDPSGLLDLDSIPCPVKKA